MPEPVTRGPRTLPVASAVALGVVVLLLLAACGGDGDTPGGPPTVDGDPVALWNPCDGMTDAEVSSWFETPFDVARGTPEAPRCTFTPSVGGDGPQVDVNYSLFPGTLDELFESFGDLDEGGMTRVRDQRVRRADEARVVTDVDDRTLAITGFVKNGDLVQVVNVVDPAPYAQERLDAAVRTLLTRLARHADSSGITGSDDDAGGSTESVTPSSSASSSGG